MASLSEQTLLSTFMSGACYCFHGEDLAALLCVADGMAKGCAPSYSKLYVFVALAEILTVKLGAEACLVGSVDCFSVQPAQCQLYGDYTENFRQAEAWWRKLRLDGWTRTEMNLITQFPASK